MKLHANAALTLNNRRRLANRICEQGWRLGDAAAASETTTRTAQKWSARYRAEGEAGLLDRSSAARRVWNRTPAERVALIVSLRRLRFSGPEIAQLLGMPSSTVSAVCKREGVGRLGRLGLEPARRYERSRPGELIHVDVKKLGRIDQAGHRALGRGPGRHAGKGSHGWEAVHIAIDDATRLAYAEVLENERAETAVGFLRRAVDFFARRGFRVERLITDNGSPYRSDPRDLLPRARHPAPANEALPAADQRQGRALHPHASQWMGMGSDLSKLPRADESLAGLARPLQLPQTTRRHRPPTARGSLSRASEQRAWVLHLALLSLCRIRPGCCPVVSLSSTGSAAAPGEEIKRHRRTSQGSNRRTWYPTTAGAQALVLPVEVIHCPVVVRLCQRPRHPLHPCDAGSDPGCRRPSPLTIRDCAWQRG